MDTPNYNEFVREITAQFELVEKAVLKNNSSKALVWNCMFFKDGKEFLQTVRVNPNETAELFCQQ